MKYIKIIITLIAGSALTMLSCGKEDVETPDACFTINDSEADHATVEVGASVVFKGCSVAEFYVVWPGDLKHDYNRRPENLTDVDQEKVIIADYGYSADLKTMSYSYIYTVAGTYTVTWVATNDGNDGEDVKSAIATKSITVE